MSEFVRTPLATLRDHGLDALLHAHWLEVGHDRDHIPLDPDWLRYYAEEQASRFVAFGFYEADVLVGYTAFFIQAGMHYRTSKFAMNDVIYLRPENRGINGIRLVVAAEQWLKAHGVKKIFYHTKIDRFLGAPEGDSLAAVEQIMEIEQEFQIQISDSVLDDVTLAGVLQRLGYAIVEHHVAKLLIGD